MNAKSSKGLGRGFDTLIPKNLDAATLLNQGERIQNILISEIKPNTEQPRTLFDEEAINELATSIKRYGIIQPLVVTPIEHNNYSIIAGERRWRAAQKAGLNRVPVIIRTVAALERLEIALIENVQRVDLSPIEQAISIEKLHQQFNMTYVDIAARLGKAPTTINNIVRLLQLPKTAAGALQAGHITEGHARAILALKGSESKQAELLKQILANNWSVRQAEQFVIASKKSNDSNDSTVRKQMATTTPETNKLSKKLGAPVMLKRTARGGRLEISFKDDKDLQRLLDFLTD